MVKVIYQISPVESLREKLNKIGLDLYKLKIPGQYLGEFSVPPASQLVMVRYEDKKFLGVIPYRKKVIVAEFKLNFFDENDLSTIKVFSPEMEKRLEVILN